ncbi:MAG: peptide MFS transporter [Bacteroidales bacterium]|jgi:POT family proton-dependent oligopeptide transporter|nr:peptide MFS transporter [Bacteroidales bacterium]
MFKEHPRGLLVLALANMGERFGYYTMIAILTLYMQAKFGLSSSATSVIYGSFLGMVYFLPLLGGMVADRLLGYGKTILLGILVMFLGYVLLALPGEADTSGKVMLFAALALIALGTGFFKGNLQALVGNLYEADIYKGKRDIAFSIFYMFINIGAFFAPSVANSINNAILSGEGFYYDASIPKNYVSLNDRTEDRATFTATVFQAHRGVLATARDSAAAIDKARKKAGVVFPEDRAGSLFNLKAAGLTQLTESGQISDPVMMVTSKEYDLLSSRKPEDAAAKAALTERIEQIAVADPKLFGDPVNPDHFAVNFAEQYVIKSLSKSYNLAFGVACISLILSVLIFLVFRRTWKESDKTHRQQLKEANAGTSGNVVVLSGAQVRERVTALLLVFFVVIFFWMSFHQNGLCMTFFARDYTVSEINPVSGMMFSLLALLPFIAVVYGVYAATMGLFGNRKNAKTGLPVMLAGLSGLVAYYFISVRGVEGFIKITPQIFQQFNPLFIVLLTPLSVALFAYLGSRNREPSAPKKIGFGMFIAALGFMILLVASLGLPAPSDIQGVSGVLVSPHWLIGTYFVLTIAELFLSPMGLSFVAKVAPPQYKGMMQGGWLAATAIGNYLVGVMGIFWDELPLYVFWAVLVICCLLSATFIFSIMKRLEKATNE